MELFDDLQIPDCLVEDTAAAVAGKAKELANQPTNQEPNQPVSPKLSGQGGQKLAGWAKLRPGMMVRHKNYPETPEKLEEFKKDYESLPMAELEEKWETKRETMKNWAKKLGLSRPKVTTHNGGARPAIVKEVAAVSRELTQAIRDNEEFQNDEHFQQLAAELEVATAKMKTSTDAYYIQPLIIKLQGLSCVRGSKNYKDFADAMAHFLEKILLMRRVEADTPIAQDSTQVMEMALGVWFTKLKSVATKGEWLIYASLSTQLAQRFQDQNGNVADAQVVIPEVEVS